MKETDEDPFAFIRRKVSTRLVAGLGGRIAMSELCRTVFREKLALVTYELGTTRRPEGLDQSWEEYVNRVFVRVMGIQQQFTRIDHVIVFLNAFPNRKSYERAGITRDVWVEYHTSAYLTTLPSLLDLACLLVNEVCELQIPDRFCRFEKVAKAQGVSGMPIAKALDEIRVACEDTIRLRHADVHRAERPDLDHFVGKVGDRNHLVAKVGGAMRYLMELHPLALKDTEQSGRQLARDSASKLRTEASQVAAKVEALFESLEPEFH